MVFVKEESEEDMSEPEPWRIKHEEQGGWCLFFIHLYRTQALKTGKRFNVICFTEVFLRNFMALF